MSQAKTEYTVFPSGEEVQLGETQLDYQLIKQVEEFKCQEVCSPEPGRGIDVDVTHTTLEGWMDFR